MRLAPSMFSLNYFIILYAVKAVVAGLGSRLLPASKKIPKKMFPVFDFEDGEMVVKLVLQIVFEQLYDAGVREFWFVVGRGKRAIEDYFKPDWSLVEELEKTGKQVQAKSLRRLYTQIEDASIVYVTQPRPLGFGHAALTAKSVVDDDFIVAGGDTYLADPAPLRELAASRPISILVKEVENPRQHGVAVIRDGVIIRVVEKPKEPPSNIATLPFYKFPRGFFKYLERVRSGVGSELQLTDTIQLAIEEGVETRPIYYTDVYFDVGTPQTYLKALEWIVHCTWGR